MSNEETTEVANSPIELEVNRKSVVITTIRQILLSIAVVVLSSTILVIAYRQQNNTGILKQANSTANDVKHVLTVLVDCTTAHHKCYDDGQGRTTDAENIIIRTIIATGVCRADHEDQTFAILYACVISKSK